MLETISDNVERFSWWVSISLFLVMAAYETVRPERAAAIPAWRRWLGHFALYAVGLLIVVQFSPDRIGPWLVPADEGRLPFSILRRIGGDVAVLVCGFLVMDLLIYSLHRIHHNVFTLWRFHSVHHSDTDVDATTTLRHHPVGFLVNAGAATIVVVSLGLSAWVFPLYGLCSLIINMFQHINGQLPAWLDRTLRLVIVSPAMHRSHHSADPAHYDSNYGNILSIWDRLLGTYRVLTPAQQQAMVFGVPGYTEPRYAGFGWMLLLPFKLRRNGASRGAADETAREPLAQVKAAGSS